VGGSSSGWGPVVGAPLALGSSGRPGEREVWWSGGGGRGCLVRGEGGAGVLQRDVTQWEVSPPPDSMGCSPPSPLPMRCPPPPLLSHPSSTALPPSSTAFSPSPTALPLPPLRCPLSSTALPPSNALPLPL